MQRIIWVWLNVLFLALFFKKILAEQRTWNYFLQHIEGISLVFVYTLKNKS